MENKPKNPPLIKTKDDDEALVEEVRRVLKLIPEIEIPEFKEKTVEVVVESVWQ